MRDNLKRLVLCVLAVSFMTVSGTTYAEGEEIPEEPTAEEDEEIDVISETEEIIDAEISDIVGYLEKTGSIDGFDIYFKDKNIDDIIWEKNGGKPKSKKDYTPEQEELSKIISRLKKLGDFAAVDPISGKAVSFSKKSGDMYISDAGRYILYMNEKKPVRMSEVISTIDDPYLFRSDDGKTLELYDKDYKNVICTYTYGGVYDNKACFFAEDENKFAWLDETNTQVLGTFRKAAENERFAMLVDDRRGIFGLKNLETDYIWWSSPLGATRDKLATPLIINEIRSSSVLRYGIPAKRSNANRLRSCTDDCDLTVSDIENGIRVVYDFDKAGFEYPVEYTLEDDHLKASLKVSDIKESDSANIATEIKLLGSFGAADMNEEGYFVIPDGSGALVRFNNRRTMETNAYNQKIYGSDKTVVPTSQGSITEQIYLPCYGIVKEDNALLAVASKGDSNAEISVCVSEQSNSSYNMCSFNFILRSTDTFYMSGSNDKLTVFESGKIKSDDVEILYYPISKENASYIDIAERYRKYLTDEKGLTKRSEPEQSSLYIDIYGGTQKKKPVFGIPVTMKQSVTTYSETLDMLKKLNKKGAENITLSYNNWTDNGINGKVDDDVDISGTLGGKFKFGELKKYADINDVDFYPVAENQNFYSGNGYYSFTDTAVRVSGAYSRIVSYDRAYGIPDGFRKNMSLLSPQYFDDVFGSLSESYSKAGLNGICTGTLTSALYGDYGKKDISRYDAMNMLIENYEKLDKNLENGILADTANAYALPYVSRIKRVPSSSSRFDIFDEDIPFYQIVIHGLIPYSSTAINASPDPEKAVLTAAVTGSELSYDMIYENISKLKDTSLDTYYYAGYKSWADDAAEKYNLLKPVFSAVSDSTITKYISEDNGKTIVSVFSDGSTIRADLEENTLEFNGKKIKLHQEKG